MRGRNTISLHYNYRADPELGKCVCAIFRIPCACPACVAQLDKYWLPNCDPSSQPRYAHAENCYYKKILEHCNYWIIMKFLDNKTPQVDFDNIHELIIAGISPNKAELVQVSGYGAIAVNG